IAGPQERSLDEDRNVKRGALRQVANVQIPAVATRRHRAILAGLGTGDADGPGKRRQRYFDARRELGNLTFQIEIEILDLTLGKLGRKLAEHSRHVEVGAVGARHNLVDANPEHVAWLRALDVHGAGQGVRAATGKVGPQ